MIAATYFSDPENARTIYLAAGVLIVFAVAVTVVTVWWWRSVRVDHQALGPLEVMSTRAWEDSDRLARRQALEAVRSVHSDSPMSAPSGVAYVPAAVPELTDDVLDEFAANDVFDEYTRLTAAGAPQAPLRPTRTQQSAAASVPELAPLPYDVETEHEHDIHVEQFDDEHYDDEFGDVWGVLDAEEGLDAGYSIDPLLRPRHDR